MDQAKAGLWIVGRDTSGLTLVDDGSLIDRPGDGDKNSLHYAHLEIQQSERLSRVSNRNL
jgi:hypothetical protein